MEKWKPSVSVTTAEIMETDTDNNTGKVKPCKPQDYADMKTTGKAAADTKTINQTVPSNMKTTDQTVMTDAKTAGQTVMTDAKTVGQTVMTDANNTADNGKKYADNTADSSKKYSCDLNAGTLPYPCAPMAFPYIPMQGNNPVRYSRMEALETGTLFPGLNLPFKAAIQARTKLSNTALVELMALDFAVQELGLYLTTHADDQEALQLYWSYLQLAKEGRERYERQYGPILQSDPTPESGYIWLNDPWPWDPDET